jgi:glycerol-3-phosphate dehydrogenase
MKTKNIIIIATGINGVGAVRSAAKASLEIIPVLFDSNDS